MNKDYLENEEEIENIDDYDWEISKQFDPDLSDQ